MPAGLPAKDGLQLGAVQLEEVCLVRRVGLRLIHPFCSVSPFFTKKPYQFPGGDAITFIGTYIVPTGIGRILILPLGNHQIGKQWLKDMLIGPG